MARFKAARIVNPLNVVGVNISVADIDNLSLFIPLMLWASTFQLLTLTTWVFSNSASIHKLGQR
jgi:hypothetical protein